MSFQLHYVISSGLCWSIALMAAGGYFLTLKRTAQKWPFWWTLCAGWGILAMSNSLIALGITQWTDYLMSIWMSSFVLIVVSMLVLFINVIQTVKVKQ
jgi:hypothetical protein